jgi:hypothetical protein
MAASDIHFFMEMRDQLKLYHWQTLKFSRHKASDVAIEKLDTLIDRYVEVYMGKYGRSKLSQANSTITVRNISDSNIVRFLESCIEYILHDLVAKKTDSALLTIRDEMLAELHQLLYLCALD